MAKHKAAAAAGPDPDGEAWTEEAGKRWRAAVVESNRLEDEYGGRALSAVERREAARARRSALDLYAAPPLPDFRAMVPKDLKLGDPEEDPILGRFVYQPGRELVHDVTKATAACRIQETPRLFVHFASELEANVPEDAEPHSCMT